MLKCICSFEELKLYLEHKEDWIVLHNWYTVKQVPG